jgi:chromosome segregation ATPase
MELFNKAFNHIKEQIAPVYKDLTKSSSWPLGGQAYLDVEEEDEPYLSGVKYHATPPGKRFRDMEHLSGGEKTMAALALLFAIHTYAPSPFFVLDEVDAALDVANTMRLANYVREKAGPGMQFVVISLKAGLFQESETLVGVMRDQGVNSSRALTLDVSYSDCAFQRFGRTGLLTMLAVAKIPGRLGLSSHDNKVPMALRALAKETCVKMVGSLKGYFPKWLYTPTVEL